MRPHRVVKLFLGVVCGLVLTFYLTTLRPEKGLPKPIHADPRDSGMANPNHKNPNLNGFDRSAAKGMGRVSNSNVSHSTNKPAVAAVAAGRPPVYKAKVVTQWERPHVSIINGTSIKESILDINFRQRVHNKVRFPTRPDDSIIIVVQVHNRPEYLAYLIDSFKRVPNMGEALLIFSHDFYSEEMNDLIYDIEFCQYMQIFYPYPLQVYQEEFPGEDPRDCPRNIPNDKAKELGCLNAESPDRYGHYREAKYVMTKHHWWWKLRHVFSQMEVTRDHHGLVLLMEEDHYVSPDFYNISKAMYQIKLSDCPECDIISLGTYEKVKKFEDKHNVVDRLYWHSTKHNMGMGIDRTAYNKLVQYSKDFCTYDDYNWDWTLQYMSKSCLPSPLYVLVTRAPRIFHIGECGVHHGGKKCAANKLIRNIQTLLKENRQYLFPHPLEMSEKLRPIPVARPPKANGGWGDVRDHKLCLSYGNAT